MEVFLIIATTAILTALVCLGAIFLIRRIGGNNSASNFNKSIIIQKVFSIKTGVNLIRNNIFSFKWNGQDVLLCLTNKNGAATITPDLSALTIKPIKKIDLGVCLTIQFRFNDDVEFQGALESVKSVASTLLI